MAASTAWWQPIGEELDAYEIPFLNPFDPGYPAWPNANRWLRLFRTPTGTGVFTTDGLGGPALPEYFVETVSAPRQLSGHWATNVLLELGRFVPSNPEGLAAMLDQAGVLSLSIEVNGAPSDWIAAQGVGLLLGLPHPLTAERSLVNVKLMRPAELSYAVDRGAAGRANLRDRYQRQGSTTISDLTRDSVV